MSEDFYNIKKETKEELEALGHKKENLMKIIRRYCNNCCGDSTWRSCGFKTCELYPYRDGHNPFSEKGKNMTEEERKIVSERLSQYRRKKINSNNV